MRLNDGSFAPPTVQEGIDHGSFASDVERAIGMTEDGCEFDPLTDTSILVEAIQQATEDQVNELRFAYHSGANERFGELLSQIAFKEAFRLAWQSLRRDEGVPDVG